MWGSAGPTAPELPQQTLYGADRFTSPTDQEQTSGRATALARAGPGGRLSRFPREGSAVAHLVRPYITHYVDAAGRRCKKRDPGAVKVTERAKLWYGCAISNLPPAKRVPLSPHKDKAQRMLARLVEKAD
jgi:hypothetical protein